MEDVRGSGRSSADQATGAAAQVAARAGWGTIWTLSEHQLRSRWRSILIWGFVLGVLGAVYIALYPSMSRLLEDYMSEAPEQMRPFLGVGDGSISIEQWVEMELLNGTIPLALPFFMMIIGARAIAGNEERKTLDLLLSNPLPRWQVVAANLLTMALALAGVLALTWVLTYLAVPFAGVDLGPGRLARGLIVLWPYCLFFGALALLVSALVRRAALAIVIPAVVLVGMYVTDTLGQVAEAVEPLRVVALQHHLATPLSGSFPWLAVLLMLAALAVFTLVAVAAFNRRDIYT